MCENTFTVKPRQRDSQELNIVEIHVNTGQEWGDTKDTFYFKRYALNIGKSVLP